MPRTYRKRKAEHLNNNSDLSVDDAVYDQEAAGLNRRSPSTLQLWLKQNAISSKSMKESNIEVASIRSPLKSKKRTAKRSGNNQAEAYAASAPSKPLQLPTKSPATNTAFCVRDTSTITTIPPRPRPRPSSSRYKENTPGKMPRNTRRKGNFNAQTHVSPIRAAKWPFDRLSFVSPPPSTTLEAPALSRKVQKSKTLAADLAQMFPGNISLDSPGSNSPSPLSKSSFGTNEISKKSAQATAYMRLSIADSIFSREDLLSATNPSPSQRLRASLSGTNLPEKVFKFLFKLTLANFSNITY